MNNFTLKQLRYFEAIATHSHFGRAAEACAVSQPALSMQIKDLENQLGMALFERTPRQLRLTAFGEAFAHRVRPALRAIDELGDMARAAQEKFVGRLRLGVIPTIAPYLLPKILADLAQNFEGLEVDIRESMTDRLLEELSTGRIDAALVALPIAEPSLMETALFQENFVLVRPLSDAHLPMPDSAALREMRLLLLEEGHCFRNQALSFCNRPNPLPREGLDGSSLATLVQLVGAGLGVTLLPEMAIEVETRAAPVSVTPFQHPQPSRTIGMIWRRTNPLSQQLSEIAEIIRQSAKP